MAPRVPQIRVSLAAWGVLAVGCGDAVVSHEALVVAMSPSLGAIEHFKAEPSATPIMPVPTDSGLHFVRRDRNVTTFFVDGGFAFNIAEPTAQSRDRSFDGLPLGDAHHARRDCQRGRRWTLHFRLLGGRSSSPRPTGSLPGRVSYITGSDARWRTNLPTHSGMSYDDVYPGIELVTAVRHHALEYGFVVAPHADPNVIRMLWSGAENLRLANHGTALELHTGFGALHVKGLHCLQSTESAMVDVPCGFAGLRQTKKPLEWDVGIEVGPYDRTRTLIIDPVVDWSSLLGGDSIDVGAGVAVDASGNLYVTGWTQSSDFPSSGGFDSTYGGSEDAFVSKIDPIGPSLVWSTYLGGSSGEAETDIAVDASGNVYLSGYTESADFPASGGFDTTFNGDRDGFVAKVNADGASLAWSSYLGGSDWEFVGGIALDEAANVYVTGATFSSDFPTPGGFDTTLETFPGKSEDAFVTKVNADGSSLAWSSYLGGDDGDEGWALTVDESGNVYVTGSAWSSDFPTSGGFQDTNRGSIDVFVTKVNADGSNLIWSSYLGGMYDEYGLGIAVDGSDNVYVTGVTHSADFPAFGGFDSTRDGDDDAFVSKVNADGSSLAWSSFLGGGEYDRGVAISLDSSRNVYVAGFTESTDFPSSGGFDINLGTPGNPDNEIDAFVTKVKSDGSGLIWSSYLGGASADFANGMVLDDARNVFVIGGTYSTDFPASGGFDTLLSGAEDAFLVRIGCATAVECDDSNACTDDSCDPDTGCAYVPAPDSRGEPCEDGDPCTAGDTCDEDGTCPSGDPLDEPCVTDAGIDGSGGTDAGPPSDQSDGCSCSLARSPGPASDTKIALMLLALWSIVLRRASLRRRH